jgi:hypothetical protein
MEATKVPHLFESAGELMVMKPYHRCKKRTKGVGVGLIDKVWRSYSQLLLPWCGLRAPLDPPQRSFLHL